MRDIKPLIKLMAPDGAILALLIIIFYIMTVSSIGHYGNPIIDVGREAYIPAEILKGKLLYRDIFILYGPFSFQLNALLYKIFGQNLSILYGAGIVNSLIILGTIYFIARNIASKWVSFSISSIVITAFIFHYHMSGYIFPYSYAITYALTGFLLSVLFCIFYLRTGRQEFMPASCFFIGISILSKIEYSLFLILIAIILFLKPLSKKNLIISLILFFSMPVLSISILFFQGLNFLDISKYLSAMFEYSKAPSLNYFYRNHSGFFLTNTNIKKNLVSFIQSMTELFLALTAAGLLVFTYKSFIWFIELLISLFKRGSFIIKILISNFAAITLLGIIYTTQRFIIYISNYSDLIMNYIFLKTREGAMSWLPISTTVILIAVIARQLILYREENLNIKEFFKKMDFKEKIFIFLAISAIIAAFKTYFFVNLKVFGTYILPLALIINIVFFVDKLPDFIGFLRVKSWKKISVIALSLLSFIFAIKNLNVFLHLADNPVLTPKGNVYTYKFYDGVMNESISYINGFIPKNARLLVIPEGVLINFLTSRESMDWFYQLTPNYIETFGEDNIVKALKKNPPDYIFINNRDSYDYGYNYICGDYGFGICGFVEKNYVIQKVILPDNGFSKPFRMVIYKLKS